MSPQSGRPPLTGIRVVDFTRVIAGPLCTQILSDMGAEIIKIENPDVVIQNFRPGVLNRYGLDYAALHETYPRLIYVSISAYGQTGPLSDRPGFDPVLQAESGMMSVNGEANGEGLRH